jgi:hypothetical protein
MQGEAGGGGTEQVRVEVGVANSEQRRGGNGLVRLELRGVAAGVPVAAWQLASEGVYASACAQAHGCKQMHPVSSIDQTVAAQRGGAPSRERRSTVGNGLPSDGLVGTRVCMPKGNPRRQAPGGTEKGGNSTLRAPDKG